MNKDNIPLAHPDYEIIKRDVLYKGFFSYARYHLRIRKFDGSFTAVFQREVLEHPPSVGILPYDPVLDRVVVIEQFRAGVLLSDSYPWVYEIIAGLHDQHETAEASIVREAEEEAACKILDLYRICEYFVTPGCCNEQLTLFCGRVDASDIGGIHGLSSECEDIRAHSLSVDEAYQWIQEGKIKTAPAIIALQWLQLNREWLKQLWQTK